jgi:hypothetical protein
MKGCNQLTQWKVRPMRLGSFPLLFAVLLLVVQSGCTQSGKSDIPAPASEPQVAALRDMKATETLDSFVEIMPLTNLEEFASYDEMNKVSVSQSQAIYTTRDHGKISADEAKSRAPRVVGQRWAKGVLPVAVWTSGAKVQRVDFLIGETGTVSIWPAEVYRSPAVLAGGDPPGLESLFNLVNGFGFPVSVRIIYEDGQVWLATFKLRELPKQ